MLNFISKHQLFQLLVSLFIVLAVNLSVQAQGWTKFYGGPLQDLGLSLQPTADGGFLLAGSTTSFGDGAEDALLYRTDPFGDSLWMKTYGGSNDDKLNLIRQTPDGNYISLGYTASEGAGDLDFFLLKTNAQGDSLWAKTYGGSNEEIGLGLVIMPDSGFAMIGNTRSFGSGPTNIWLIRTDKQGDTLWTRTLGGTEFDGGFDLHLNSTGNLILAGSSSDASGNYEAFIAEVAPNGQLNWQKRLGGAGFQGVNSIQPTPDGGYLFGGYDNQGGANAKVYLLKTNSTGDSLWAKSYGEAGYNFSSGHSTYRLLLTWIADQPIVATPDSGFLISAFRLDPSFQLSKDVLLKINANGDSLWTKNYFNNPQNSLEGATLGEIRPTTDGGYALLGYRIGEFGIDYDAFLVKTDSLLQVYSNTLSGYAFEDGNANCGMDGTELPLRGIIVSATHLTTGQQFYASTDSNGYYSMQVDSGSYQLLIQHSYNYYSQSCLIPGTISFNGFYNHDSLDIPFAANTTCPLVQVDVATPLLRRCMPNPYTVQYCNYGSAPALNTGIWVELDPYLIVDSTSIPVNQQSGDSLFFNLGTLAVGQCGSFVIYTTLDCDSTITGQSHCVTASAQPDTICNAPSLWDGSNIEIDAWCDGDSVRFEIKNQSAFPMLSSSTYIIIEDDLIFLTAPFQLGAGAVLELAVPADGRTWRMQTSQSPNHPYAGEISAQVEGCKGSRPSFSIGFLTMYPTQHPSPHIAVDCRENRASHDPNDKQAQPVGFGLPHYIDRGQSLEYTIRFQNTGNDTAFRVMLLDTLSPYLDPSTIVMGSSSHPYSWELVENGILKVVYSPIELPDSNINEIASHGFIKFRIHQRPNLPLGTVINNQAGIYFDFNPVVMTNSTFHTLGENYILVDVVRNYQQENIQIQPIPNPFSDQCRLQLTGMDQVDKLEVEVFDLQGRAIPMQKAIQGDQLILYRGQLAAGMYVLSIRRDGQQIAHAKLIIQ